LFTIVNNCAQLWTIVNNCIPFKLFGNNYFQRAGGQIIPLGGAGGGGGGGHTRYPHYTDTLSITYSLPTCLQAFVPAMDPEGEWRLPRRHCLRSRLIDTGNLRFRDWSGIKVYWSGIKVYWSGIKVYWSGIKVYWSGLVRMRFMVQMGSIWSVFFCEYRLDPSLTVSLSMHQ